MPNFSSVVSGKPVTWSVELTPSLVHEICGLHSVDLMDAEELASIRRNGELFVSIMYLVCREQIEQLRLSPQEFGLTMAPAVLKLAAEALCAAIVDLKPAWRRNRKTRNYLMGAQ